MVVCLEVILWAFILPVCPMVLSSPTHFCIAELCCGIGGKMAFVKVYSCCMSGGIAKRYKVGSPYAMTCFWTLLPNFLLFVGKNITLLVGAM